MNYPHKLAFRPFGAMFFSMLLSVCLALGFSACEVEEGNAESTTPTASVAETPPNTLTDAERAEGWVLLFDGESFDGWRGYRKDAVPTDHWKIEDGSIHKIASGDVPLMADGQPQQGGDIITLKKYENFELSFEWKVAQAANSGIKYNVIEEMSDQNPLGFEYQVLDDENHPDAKMGNGTNRTASGLYDLISPKNNMVKPVGQWNHGRIIFNEMHGEHWLNGQKVLEYDLNTPRMDSLLAASKYAPIEGFGDKKVGHVVLQDHNDDVWYRNIKIREL
ncbi:MAG: DUF1080 domain-containing protein [Rhodothermaceae bacterium]|nr:DUF1080 domain-containing protein [Rhodothermaceae bacterium]